MRNRYENFLTGMGTLFDIGGFYPRHFAARDYLNDLDSLRSDWENVGRDILHAIESYYELRRREPIIR